MQTQTGQFTHTPQPPKTYEGEYSDQRYFGGKKTQHGQAQEVLHLEGASHCSQATVIRFAHQDFCKLSLDVGTDDVRQCTSLRLTADQLETLARALIDAAHDLRTQPSQVLLQQREEVAA